MKYLFVVIKILTLITMLWPMNAVAKGKAQLLHASFDTTRELYKDINQAFAAKWKQEHNIKIHINQSHGGSHKQAQSVIEGLEADILTLAVSYDIDMVAEKGLVNRDWRNLYPNHSAPYGSTIVFLVRKDNPKNIQDWEDLIRPSCEVIMPHPNTSGGARWNYVAAWAYGLKLYNQDEAKAQDFVNKLYKNVPVMDAAARGSTMTFVHRNIGDVLVTWESEALLVVSKEGKEKYEIIYPSQTVYVELPVTIVDKNVNKHGAKEIADSYLKFLYSDSTQEIIAANNFRPIDQQILAKNRHKFPVVNAISVDELGGWDKLQRIHFNSNGMLDHMFNSR
jgi:sulfate transport system substrate-binding protein